MQCSVFIAISLDGFIAGPAGELDWLERLDTTGEDHGYEALMASVDCLVMGRNTFEKVLSFGQWPYGETPVVVLSHRLNDLPEVAGANLRRYAGEPKRLVADLAEAGMQRIYVDGGNTIQQFLAQDLIDDMVLTRIPVLLGAGIPLFAELQQRWWRHQSTRSFPSGLVQSCYVKTN